MGFFYTDVKKSEKAATPTTSGRKSQNIPIASLNQLGCKVCPLDKEKLSSPKMEATGSLSPVVYMLGEAPGAQEDEQNEQFVGKSGKLIRSASADLPYRRWNNTVRCRPPANRTPTEVEVECCRGFVTKDIEQSRPLVVVGAGNVPLSWATGLSGINAWRGTLVATKIGDHKSWYYPILHPAFVLRKKGKYSKSEYELQFDKDLEHLAKLVNSGKLTTPEVWTRDFDKGVEVIQGRGSEDFHRLEDILNGLVSEPYLAHDIETTCLRVYKDNAKILTASFGTFDKSVSFPVDHPEGWSSNFRSKIRGLYADFLLSSGRKICHNLSFELEWIAYHFGNEVLYKTEWEDTMLQSHTLDERQGTHSLDNQCRKHFGFFLKALSKGINTKNLLGCSLPEVLKYNALDSKWTYRLFEKQLGLIQEEPAYIIEYERKVRLAPSLVMIEQKGVPADISRARELQDDLSAQVKKIDNSIHRCAEVEKYKRKYGAFNITSNDHVAKLMVDICGRSEVKEEDGSVSTDEEALHAIPADEVPSASLILEHRAVSKLLSTYVQPIVSGKIVYSDGRMHTKYSSNIAVTGRLASEDPNIQNFPKRKHQYIRSIVCAGEGMWIVAADYGQIEARVIGMASEDANLVKYLWTNYDIHGFWAERVMSEYPRVKDRMISEYGVDGDDDKKILKTFRNEIKNGWVFPQFFGSSYRSCARNLQIPEILAQDLTNEFWDEFSGVKKWQDRLLKKYERTLYVETLLGRRRRGPMTKNEIINHPIQGTACDIVTAAQVSLSERSIREDNEELQPNLNLHDDLSFWVKDDHLESHVEVIAKEMCEHRFDFINVPLVVEVAVGERWDSLEEIGIYRSNEIFKLRNPYDSR